VFVEVEEADAGLGDAIGMLVSTSRMRFIRRMSITTDPDTSGAA
jgi:hypothetical protein